MRTSLEQQDRQFLEELHRLGPATVQEIGERLGVTATAVRQRLSRMDGRGLVAKRVVREGRGRPHHVYEVTQTALQNLGDNYSDLALILWQEMMQIEEPEIQRRLLGRIKEALIRRYGHGSEGRTVLERFGDLRNALHDRGFSVEVDRDGELPILRENNCPYLELATHDSSICELEHSVFEEVLGTRIERTQCCLEGHHCCEFTPVSETA